MFTAICPKLVSIFSLTWAFSMPEPAARAVLDLLTMAVMDLASVVTVTVLLQLSMVAIGVDIEVVVVLVLTTFEGFSTRVNVILPSDVAFTCTRAQGIRNSYNRESRGTRR